MILGLSMPCRGGGFTAYSPWFPRRGNAATFVCEVIGLSSEAVFDVTVQHKNLGDTDASAATAGSFSTISSAGVSTLRASGLKELVRLKYVANIALESAFDWVHFRMLDPSWERNAGPGTAPVL